MSSAAGTPPQTASGPRSVRLVLLIILMVLVLAQFYLAGRGVFGAGGYGPHRAVGMAAQLVGLLVLVATVAVPATRNGRDTGMAAGLFVLLLIQGLIAKTGQPELNAIHPFTAVLIVGFGFHLLGADRRAARGS